MTTQFYEADYIVEHYSGLMEKPVQSYASYMATKALDDFSLQLVNYRLSHQLSQKDLAKELGITQPMVSEYEAGSANITIKRLCEICELIGLRVTLEYENLNSSVAANSNNPYKCDSENIEIDVA